MNEEALFRVISMPLSRRGAAMLTLRGRASACLSSAAGSAPGRTGASSAKPSVLETASAFQARARAGSAMRG
jgi:hypothetical protein